MDMILFTLTWLLAALTFQRIILRPAARRLKAREQAYRFHALRDELQSLALDGKIDRKSVTYAFLMTAVNTAIKNAGLARLRELNQAVQRMEIDIPKERIVYLMEDAQKHDKSVRELGARIFIGFALMLISNDWIAFLGFKVRHKIGESRKAIKPLLSSIDKLASSIFGFLAPHKLAAVKDARWYSRVGHRMADS